MVMSLVVSSSLPWLVGCHSDHCCCDRCEVCAEEEETVEHQAYSKTEENLMAALQQVELTLDLFYELKKNKKAAVKYGMPLYDSLPGVFSVRYVLRRKKNLILKYDCRGYWVLSMSPLSVGGQVAR